MRVLDLFCGAGGAAMGLHHAWPDAEIVGVDIEPQPRYPFTFLLGDAMTYPLGGFDFIWASPPCQFYSNLTPAAHKANHQDLIAAIRKRLRGLTYCIENVAGARKHLVDPTMLCGSMFGLKCFRHRFFETSFPVCVCKLACNHNYMPLLVTTASKASRAIRKPGAYKSVKNAPLAYGINWMDFRGLKEAIPPAYSEYIARQWTNDKKFVRRRSRGTQMYTVMSAGLSGQPLDGETEGWGQRYLGHC